MYHSEKRSLYRFITIYLISTFILFFIGLTIFYAYERHNLLDQQRESLEREGDRLRHELMVLHQQFTERLPLPQKKPFDILLFEIDKKLIFKTFEPPSTIDFMQDFYIEKNSIFHVKKIDPYYLGVAYLVLKTPIDQSRIVDLQKMILLFMLGAGVFFLIIGYFLGRLFVAPMRESIEMLNRFIQDTTHELNTPISTILTNLELMDTLEKCNAKKEMQRIEIASKTLSRIYDDLTYLKLHHNYHRDIKPLNLSTFIEERLLYFSSAIEAKKITVVDDIVHDIILEIDRDDATRVIDNLISNAIKYNHIGGKLHIYLDNNILKVKDSGIGIADGEIKNIFDRFSRANQNEGGFGIGLNIVYQIAKAYDFDISIRSKLDIETEVTIQW
ncbi:MAG: HAMP domain-containing sensor histidine kinase [Campylobacterota bacterium]|nr:HAMP domain-containing sensor histidine kinase [Campylobacterota bacterium]